jgi:uncharacterized membrane protein
MRPWIIDADDIDPSGDFRDSIERTPGINDFLGRSSSRFIVTATKGYGKTLLLKAKRISIQDEMVCVPANSLLDKPIGDTIFGRSMIEMLSGSTQHWRRIWRVAICCAVLKRLDLLGDLDVSGALARLLEHRHLESVVDHFVNILDMKPNEIIEAAGDTDRELVPRLRSIGTPVAVFIDSVDEYFNKHIGEADLAASQVGETSPEIWYLSQMALVEAAYELRRVTHHLKVFAAVRKEAYVRLSDGNAMGLQYSGSVVDLTYSKTDLREMVCDNVRAEARSNLVDPTQLRHDPIVAFVGRKTLRNSYTGEEEEVFDYFYRHTFQRPRDLMTIGARLSVLPPERRKDPETTKRVVNDAATETAGEYLAEIEPYLRGADLRRLWSIVPGPILTPAELDDVVVRFDAEGGGVGLGGRQMVTLLYKTGLLGYTVEDVAAGGLCQRFVAPGERTFDPDATLPATSNYLMHPALTEIISGRNRRYPTRIDRVNILGAGRPWRTPSPSTVTRRHFVLKADIRAFSRFMADAEMDQKVRKALAVAVQRHAEDAVYSEVVQGDEVTIVDDNAEGIISAAQRIMEDLYRVEGRPLLRVAIVYDTVRLEKVDGRVIVRGGAGLRLAARIEPLVRPNEIWVDELVKKALDDAAAFYTAEPLVPGDDVATEPGAPTFDVRKRDTDDFERRVARGEATSAVRRFCRPAIRRAGRIATMERRSPQLNFFPLHGPVVAGLIVVVGFLLVLLEINAVEYAYERIGMSPRSAVAYLIFSLLGSYVNIPVRRYHDDPVIVPRVVDAFAMRWRVVGPTPTREKGTVLAVNVGGAIAPTLLALRLMAVSGIWLQAAIAIVVVAVIVHAFARPIAGMGISVPMFIPPIAAVVVAWLISPRLAPAVAFCGGTLGTLIGADLSNLRKIRALGAPVASIGGAGTFDGIFVTGVLAVLLA